MSEAENGQPEELDSAAEHLARMEAAQPARRERQVQRSISRTTPERNEAIAMMLACGRYSMKDIAENLNVSVSLIRTLRGSPLFKERVRELQSKMYDSHVEAALGDLMQDIQRNIDWMRDVQEGRIVDNPAALAVRARMATALFERQVPKAERRSESGGIRITINQEVKEKFTSAAAELEEYGAIEVEAEEVDG